jgi:hypothetical protein
MKIMVFLCTLAVLGCTSTTLNSKRENREPTYALASPSRLPSSEELGSLGGPPPTIPQNQRIDFAKLIKVAKAQGSIENSLRYFSKACPEYLKFHTLMYNSFSIQQSTFTKPRAIVFGPDVSFVFSFNDKDMMGGDSFETMEYSVVQGKFLFREIIFKHADLDRDSIRLEPSEIAYEDEKLIVSNANPGKCQACHGKSSNPIWSTYFIWPGAYGSNFNVLYNNFWPEGRSGIGVTDQWWKEKTTPQSQAPFMILSAGVEDKEVQGMMAYLRVKVRHPRYRWLPAQITDQAFLDVASGKSMLELDLTNKIIKERDRVHADRLWPQRPNQFFQLYLMHQNERRILKAVQSAGLVANSLKGPSWEGLNEDGANLTLSKMAARIDQVLQQYKFMKKRPDVTEIEKRLRANMLGEIETERETISTHQDNFGPGSLSFILTQPDYPDTRLNVGWTNPKNIVDFYSNLLGLKTVSNIDRIAFQSDADSPAVLLALQLILEDRGVELEDYNMNHRQLGMTFYLQGLQELADYLGVDETVTGSI